MTHIKWRWGCWDILWAFWFAWVWRVGLLLFLVLSRWWLFLWGFQDRTGLIFIWLRWFDAGWFVRYWFLWGGLRFLLVIYSWGRWWSFVCLCFIRVCVRNLWRALCLAGSLFARLSGFKGWLGEWWGLGLFWNRFGTTCFGWWVGWWWCWWVVVWWTWLGWLYLFRGVCCCRWWRSWLFCAWVRRWVFLFLRVVFNPYRCCYRSTVGVLWWGRCRRSECVRWLLRGWLM